jgi:hypothetical protein
VVLGCGKPKPPLQISLPPNDELSGGQSFTFTVSGGTAPYTFTITPAGLGTFTPNETEATFIAPQAGGPFMIKSVDANNDISSVIVYVK